MPDCYREVNIMQVVAMRRKYSERERHGKNWFIAELVICRILGLQLFVL